MSFSFLQFASADVCHAIGGIVLIVDAGLLTLLAFYWREAGTPRPMRHDNRRSTKLH